jgi:penicillin-binding protein 1A
VAHRFGVTTNIPAYLPVALGAVEVTLEEQVAAYAVFPNDGIRVKPRLIRKVSNADGITLWEEPPAVDEVIAQPTARTMMTLLRAVTQHGTGASAAQLKHPLGGKTGTTSDFTDAWFLGFSPSVTCGVWVGYDNNQSLGEKETGAQAALPIWINVMRAAIAGKDGEQFPSDEVAPPLQKASAQPQPAPTLGRPAAPKAAAKLAIAPPSAAAPAKPAAPPNKPAAQPVKSGVQPAARPAAKPPAASAPVNTSAGPQVRPALPPPQAPPKPALIVKPALENTSGPD